MVSEKFDTIDNTENCFTHRHTRTDVKRHQTTVEIISLQDDSCIMSVARPAKSSGMYIFVLSRHDQMT